MVPRLWGICALPLLLHGAHPQSWDIVCDHSCRPDAPGTDPHAVVSVLLMSDHATTGWDVLELVSPDRSWGHGGSATANDTLLAYAAGFGEGFATASRIASHYANVVSHYGGSLPAALMEYATAQAAYIRGRQRSDPDIYWYQATLLLAMADGLYDGYTFSGAPALSRSEIFLLNYMAEWGDILSVVNASGFPQSNFSNLSLAGVLAALVPTSHCSASIKVTPTLSELYTAHTTWFEYRTMTRIFKHYSLRFAHAKPMEVSFPSYPGALSSIDDFYSTPQFSVLETTNPVFVPKNSSCVNASSVPTWMRAVLANTLATSGSSWAELFVRDNSGVYNNQWLVVDYSIFTPGMPLPDGLLWCVEVLPCYSHAQDITQYLRAEGQFASYNMPLFPGIRDLSGTTAMEARFGDVFSHKECPRAKIFRRDLPGALSLADVQKIMRSNDWEHDPLSQGYADFQIAARHDLDVPGGNLSTPCCGGATDSKVTSVKLRASRRSTAVAYGPPYLKVPPLDLNTSARCAGGTWKGMPDIFRFDWTVASAELARPFHAGQGQSLPNVPVYQ